MNFIDYVEIFLSALSKMILTLCSVLGIFSFILLIYLLPAVIK